tara:strand:- start:68 stop:361 length:294 start_codon:yes stop_codon:yes gene_type:complete
MKISKRQLKRIIKEEKAKLQKENTDKQRAIDREFARSMQSDLDAINNRDTFDGAMLDLDDYDNLRESLQEFAKEFAYNTGYEVEDILYALKTVAGEL